MTRPIDQETEQEAVSLALRDEAAGIRVRTDQEFEVAAEFLIRIKAAKKRVEDVIGPFVKDAHAAWKAAVARRKEIEAPLDEAEAKVKPLLSAYQEQKERQAILEREAQAEAVAAGDVGALMEPVSSGEAPKVAGMSFREHWQFEITDARQVPREFLMPDEGKIGGVVRAMKGSASIPGVRVWMTKIPVGR